MKPFLPLLFLCVSLTTAAQNSNFAVGVAFHPARSGNIISNDGTTLGSSSAPVRTTKKQTFGYYAYLFAQYTINPSWRVQTGIGYSKLHYLTGKVSNLLFAAPNDPLTIKYTPFSWVHQDLIVSVLCRYNLTKRKNNFYLIGSFTSQIKLSRIKKQEAGYLIGIATAEEDHDPTTDYRKLNLNGTIGIDYDLKISSRTSLFFQPTFDCNLLDTAKSGSLHRKVYAVGLSIGLAIG